MNAPRYEIEALAAVTSKFIDHRPDNPNNNALAAFEKLKNFAAGFGEILDR